MKLINTFEYIEKKSKFIGLSYEVNSEDEVKHILNELKLTHKKAKHIPYAYKIDNLIKKSDDKEPANTAGLPMYNIIIQKDLNNILLVVVRYFGGIKLGSGPLFRAYNKAANGLF